MKILLLCHEHPPLGGGGGSAAAEMAGQLAAMGHELLFVTSRIAGQPAEETVNGYRILRFDIGRRNASGCSIPELVRFAVTGCPVVERAAGTFKPDILLAYFTIPEGLIAYRLFKKTALPYAVYLRGGDVPGFLSGELGLYQALTTPLIRRIWQNARELIANSEYLARLAKRTSPREAKVVPNGFYRGAFVPDPSRRPTDHVRLLFSGRLVGQKGVDTLLKALAALPDRNVKLDIVGSGPLENKLKGLSRSLGLDGRVVFNGWVPRDRIVSYYQGAYILVLPSLDEGIPNVATEAAACGLAIVGTRAGGIPEVVREGYNGYLVPCGDAKALADALNRLLRDPAELRRLGENSLAFSRSYSWSDAAHLLVRVLNGERKAS